MIYIYIIYKICKAHYSFSPCSSALRQTNIKIHKVHVLKKITLVNLYNKYHRYKIYI